MTHCSVIILGTGLSNLKKTFDSVCNIDFDNTIA